MTHLKHKTQTSTVLLLQKHEPEAAARPHMPDSLQISPRGTQIKLNLHIIQYNMILNTHTHTSGSPHLCVMTRAARINAQTCPPWVRPLPDRQGQAEGNIWGYARAASSLTVWARRMMGRWTWKP